MKANFSKNELSDIAQHGANSGWHGLTWYTDTSKLYSKFKDELWELLTKESENCGYKNPFEFISTFRHADICSAQEVECLIVWFAAENVAHELTV